MPEKTDACSIVSCPPISARFAGFGARMTSKIPVGNIADVEGNIDLSLLFQELKRGGVTLYGMNMAEILELKRAKRSAKTPEADIVTRLRERAGQPDESDWHSAIELEAAQEIHNLRAALRAALAAANVSPLKDLCETVKSNIMLCDHGYIGSTCGHCLQRMLQR